MRLSKKQQNVIDRLVIILLSYAGHGHNQGETSMSVILLRPADPVLRLMAAYPARTVSESYPTEAAAWAARDRHLDAGATDVVIKGLAQWGVSGGCEGCGDGLRLSE
jgi:hypothetical protein